MEVHGMTGRRCEICERNTPHLIVEDKDTGVKLYLCVNHTEAQALQQGQI